MKQAGLLLMMCGLMSGVYGQTAINKSYAVKPGQAVSLMFDYPELVKISSWENDEAFELHQSEDGRTFYLESRIRDLKNLPQRITVVENGNKMVFRTKADYKKYEQEHGRKHDFVSWGQEIDIVLEVKVPAGTDTRVKSVYGMVEVTNFTGPLQVNAVYGGVDAALREPAIGEIVAETNFGQIYTNLDVKFSGEGMRQKDFHTWVSARPGSGPRCSFESEYGNVYLRKANN
jgi:hypothetical protein